MSKSKVLIAHRPGTEIEAMLENAPSELDIQFLPEGEKLGDHVSDVEIVYGTVSESDFPKAKALRPFDGYNVSNLLSALSGRGSPPSWRAM